MQSTDQKNFHFKCEQITLINLKNKKKERLAIHVHIHAFMYLKDFFKVDYACSMLNNHRLADFKNFCKEELF